MRPRSLNSRGPNSETADSHRMSAEAPRRALHRKALVSASWRLCTRVLAAASLAVLCAALLLTGARAQGQSILSPGDAVVTGFSGIKAPDAPVPAGTNPLDTFTIDLDGPSAQIFRLGVPGAPPQGQLISVPAPYKVLARDVGQVFAITFDDSPIPNIYLGATSAFGIQIVGADANGDGRPDRLKKGRPDAQWMPGQFGTGKGGGPGSIYKVDGRTGAVTLFATIPDNSGASLGDIVFDKASRHFFVSDLDTGLIHRLDANGALIDSFDHGTTGRSAKGLPAVADDGATMNIKGGGFDVENSDTWGFTQPERRVWGMAIHRGRLFYAVADGPQVWSVGINIDGSFAGDARFELEVSGADDGQMISDILFDAEGRMHVAQRGAARGSYDYSVFAEPQRSTVLRYTREEPDDPATPNLWMPVAEEYAIGFPAEYRNAAGGIALGSGNRMLWSTGDNLRNNPEHAGALAAGGAMDVHGVQGNDVALVRPQNEPPFSSYFVDYDGKFGDPEKAGHVGDIEIWQAGERRVEQLPPDYVPFGDDLFPGHPPGPGDDVNLRLTKRATPKDCTAWFGGWLCKYTVRVTNTGPGRYIGPILITDWLPAAPAGVVTGFWPKPPWNCGVAGPAERWCIFPHAFLDPGDSVADLHVAVWVPKTYPRCRLVNAARIDWAPGGDSDPSDDYDSAVAFIPAEHCPSTEEKTTNLSIKKEVTPAGCFNIGGGKHRCAYRVTVRNEGPGDYNGQIVVEDTIPGGTTATFSGPMWALPCVGGPPTYTCTRAAELLTAGEERHLIVRVDIPNAFAKHWNCKLRNKVKITFAPGSSDQNTDPTDDEAEATANLPAWLCQDPPQKLSNLSIKKEAGSCYKNHPLSGNPNAYTCVFTVTVTNEGPDDYNGPIKFSDTVPAGTELEEVGPPWWSCGGASPNYTCSRQAGLLAKQTSTSTTVLVYIPEERAKQLNCKVTNKVKIIDPLGGNENTDPLDDASQATGNLPAEACDERTNLVLSKGGYGGVVSPDCPLTGNATWCKKFRIAVTNSGPGTFNGQIKVSELPPANTKMSFDAQAPWTCNAATKICQTNGNVVLKPHPPSNDILVFNVHLSGDNNDAKALNCKVNNWARIISPVGPPKNTQAADDQGHWAYNLPAELCLPPPVPIREPVCPAGFRWNGDRCGPLTLIPPPPPPCPNGQSLSKGHCCPAGLVWTGRRCGSHTVEEPKCPHGTVGQWPNCRKPECSAGMVGRWPNCRKPECPAGTIGKWPHCKRPETKCPSGMVGTPPNCRKPPTPTCRSGMTGKPPNCRTPVFKRPSVITAPGNRVRGSTRNPR